MKIWETKNGSKIYQVLSGRSNVFLVTIVNKTILVDTGPAFMWKTLEKRLKFLNISNIDYLILTHTHFDHAANAHKIKEEYKAQILVHKNEASFLASGENIIPEGTNLFTRTIVYLFIKRLISFSRYKPCMADLLIDKAYDMNYIGLNVNTIHTPGHTSGSVSVIIDNEIALVGDTMFGIFNWSVFPPFANDIIQMIRSWGRLLETDCQVFIPSHGTANSRLLVQKEFNKWIGFYNLPKNQIRYENDHA